MNLRLEGTATGTYPPGGVEHSLTLTICATLRHLFLLVTGDGSLAGRAFVCQRGKKQKAKHSKVPATNRFIGAGTPRPPCACTLRCAHANITTLLHPRVLLAKYTRSRNGAAACIKQVAATTTCAVSAVLLSVMAEKAKFQKSRRIGETPATVRTPSPPAIGHFCI